MFTKQEKFIKLLIMGVLTFCMVFWAPQIVLSAEKVTLRFTTQWTLDWEARAFPEIIKKFEAIHPNIKVDLSPGFAGYETKIRAEFLSEDPPDMANMNPYTLSQLVNTGAIYDLTEFYAENGWDKGYFYPICSAAEKRNGRYYSATGQLSPEGVWYNKGVFEKYGLPKPTNWDELMQVSKKLKVAGIIPIVCNAGDWGSTVPQAIFSAQVVGFDNIMKANAGKIPWTSEVFVKPLRIIMDLVKSEIYPASMTGVDMSAAINLFATGKGAMLMGGVWFVQSFYEAAQALKGEGVDFRFGFLTDLKFVPNPRNILVGCCQGPFAVSAKSKHLQETLEFFKFFYQPENQELIATKAMIMSPVVGVKTSPIIPKEVLECLPTLTADSLFFNDYADPVVGDCEIMGGDINAMMLGKITPEEVMQRAQKRFDEAHK